jgi:NADH-quinone oxidoreductase subunit M
MVFSIPVLTLIMLSPVVGAAIIAVLPREKTDTIKTVAAAAAFLSLLLSFLVFSGYDRQAGGFQFTEQSTWIPTLGIGYHVAVDGFSAPMLLLTGIVFFGAVLISWRCDDRVREYFAFLLILVAGVFGAFMSLDIFLFLIFYEMVLFPVYVLIAGWGSTRKEYAAMKLTIYLFVGSLVAIVGLLVVYFSAGMSFDFVTLQANVSKLPAEQFATIRPWFLAIFIGFGVLASLWPLHNWSPDGYAAAPTAVSMLHGGVLKATGAYAALRFGVQLMPEAAKYYMPIIVFLALANVIYAGVIAFNQKDLKYIVGFASVSHLGLVLLGIAALNTYGLNGAGLELFAGGVMTGLMFGLVGIVYERAHNRNIDDLNGFSRIMPLAAVCFVIAALTAMGMPGLPGFAAEVQIFMGLWQAAQTNSLMFPGLLNWWYGVVAIVGIAIVVITAAWTLRAAYRVFFSDPVTPEWQRLPGLDMLEKIAISFMSAILIVVGLMPNTVMAVIQSGVQLIVKALTTTGG